ncbi:MAG: PQQ-binding-like beta-propeller repeat protein [Actinobacteria bacterium]|nr:PQQ-binding-like beta-propeller repeat protein [Actinomycetota bacterium]
MRRSSLWFVALAVVLVGLAGCDWQMVRFDAGRTAHNPLSGMSAENASRLGMAWSVTGDGFNVGTQTPVVLEANGIVVYGCAVEIGCAFDGFAAANASDGTFRWSASGRPGAIDANTVYATVPTDPQQTDYKLTALALGSGAVTWSIASKAAGGTSGNFGQVVAVDHGKVFVLTTAGSGHGAVGALDVWDAASRRVVWSVAPVSSAPAISDGRVFVFEPSPGRNPLYALDENTGGQIWSAPATTVPCNSDLVVSGGYLFTDGASYRTQDGTVAGHWPVCPSNFTFAADGTNLFAVQLGATISADELVSFDGVSGAVHWSSPIGGEASAAPVIGDGVIFVSNALHLLGFDTANGSPVSVVPSVGAILNDPVLGQGILLATTNNKVYAWRPTS